MRNKRVHVKAQKHTSDYFLCNKYHEYHASSTLFSDLYHESDVQLTSQSYFQTYGFFEPDR